MLLTKRIISLPVDAAHKKLETLKQILVTYDSAIIAFSGGVDSTFLLKVAHNVLGSKVIAVTATSPSMPAKELEETKKLAQDIGVRHFIVQTKELDREGYRKNAGDRCYHCKTELYSRLDSIGREFAGAIVLNGLNMDDVNDYRPGMKAANEWKVQSPLREAKLTKAEIRSLSKELGLPTHDKPSSPCLSSRIPHGMEVTKEKLMQVESGEEFLRSLGIRELRLRHHGDICRIEVNPKDFTILIENNKEIVRQMKKLGFRYVTMDLLGFRSGALNEVLIPWNKNI
ncbi:MAG TPA: ATP-dependent sacrificial sulfur transferase LarE [Candidatus Nanoarchaeia archaeon]|nr:ATP-dependent sacrificial sulfur transferase LarE [Candidatus Nanoarchaeia archaeon]